MVRITVPSDLDKMFVGLDQILNELNSVSTHTSAQSNYPPYNFVNLGDNKYEIQIALAGFKPEDLKVVFEDGYLTVSTTFTDKKVDPDSEGDQTPYYVHRGIAKRSFRRVWKLIDTIEIQSVEMDNGILTIKMENIIPESKKPKVFTIGKKLLQE